MKLTIDTEKIMEYIVAPAIGCTLALFVLGLFPAGICMIISGESRSIVELENHPMLFIFFIGAFILNFIYQYELALRQIEFEKAKKSYEDLDKIRTKSGPKWVDRLVKKRIMRPPPKFKKTKPIPLIEEILERGSPAIIKSTKWFGGKSKSEPIIIPYQGEVKDE
jgi:hypothetical protein